MEKDYTIDQAIIYFEIKADTGYGTEQRKIARQVVRWLKELKQYRDKENDNK